MQKHIVFINPFPEKAKGINIATIEPPLGLAYLASVLENKGHQCQLIDANILKILPERIKDYIIFSRPDLIGISTNIVTSKSGLKTAEILKKCFPDVRIVFGGAFPSSMPVFVLNNHFVDGVIIGEGELTILEIVEHLDRDEPFIDIDGLTYKNKEGAIINNQPRTFINNLDEIPFPAYHLLPDFNLYKSRSRRKPVASILTSRGCPYQCIFCSKDVFKDCFRARSPENILEEMDYLVKNTV